MKVSCQILMLVFLVLIITSCGQKVIPWPKKSGYVVEATHRPSSPHKVEKCATNVYIEDEKNGEFLMGGEMAFGAGGQLFIHPGAIIKNSVKSQKPITLTDYNGDNCVLPYGITVCVNEYGQFDPIEYKP